MTPSMTPMPRVSFSIGSARFAVILVAAASAGLLLGTPAALGATAAGAPRDGTTAPRPAAAVHYTFRGVGDLPGGRVQSEALGVSEDGRVVFGESASERSSGGAEAFVWTEKDGLRPLGGAFPPAAQSQPRASSPDGRILVGHSISPSGMPIATIWKGSEPPRALGDLVGGGESSGALAVSADGDLVVGWGTSQEGNEAARWKSGAPAEALGDLPGGPLHSGAALVTRDRSTIVGTGSVADGQEIAVWSKDGVRGLGDLPGGERRSEPFAMTPKGDVVVGRAVSASCMEAARWTAAEGLVGLGDLPGGACESIAFGIASDGGTIVGSASSESGQEAFLWTKAAGMRSLRTVLREAGVREVEGWTLAVANGISGDGRVIVGGGVNPAGNSEGWIVRIPKGR